MTRTYEQLERARDRVDTGDKIVDAHFKTLYDEVIRLRWEFSRADTMAKREKEASDD